MVSASAILAQIAPTSSKLGVLFDAAAKSLGHSSPDARQWSQDMQEIVQFGGLCFRDSPSLSQLSQGW